MRLSNLIAPSKGLTLRGADREIAGITADSRLVKEGFLFAAIPGTQQDGRLYIKDAIGRGAVAVLAPVDTAPEAVPGNISLVTATDARVGLSFMASLFYPRQPEHIAAVTGTSGKTSIAQFTRELWAANGHMAASLGTLGLVTPKEKRYGSLTTPDAVLLHQILDEAAGQGVTHLALEASSHGLDLHRLDHVRVSIGAFTNLSRDHLDYHDSMESYLAAKTKLFTQVMASGGTAVLNADAPEYETLALACRERGHRIISYGRSGHDIRLKEHRLNGGGQTIHLDLMGRSYEAFLPVAGEFQVWNSLCALGMVIGSGGDPARSAAGMEKLTGVPGRLEHIGTTKSGGAVFVDYAHKPGALENVLMAMRSHVTTAPGARLHVVFGCGGNRDKGKRPQMGAIAQRLADVVIVTDDNPRREIPEEIRRDILAGCVPGPNLREIGDRAEAIHAAIASLKRSDVLVIAGKGHETGQIVGEKVLPFDDAAVAREALEKETA